MSSINNENRKNNSILEYLFSADAAGVSDAEEAGAGLFAYDAEKDLILVSFAVMAGLLNGDRALQSRFRSFAGQHPTANLAAGNLGSEPRVA